MYISYIEVFYEKIYKDLFYYFWFSINIKFINKIEFVNKVVDKKYNTFDLLRIADYIITDYSAVAFEASILNKPIYFYVYDIEDYKKTRGLNIDLLD